MQEVDIYDPKRHKRSAGFTTEERESFSKVNNLYTCLQCFGLQFCDAFVPLNASC